jgi:hypothetical protein
MSDFDERFSYIDYWATSILCERGVDNTKENKLRDQWFGPVTNFIEKNGVYSIIASDLTAWWTRDDASTVTYVDQDVVNIVTDLIERMFSGHPFAMPTLDTAIAGALDSLSYEETQDKSLADIVKDLGKLNYFAFGKTVYLRGVDSQVGASLQLNDMSWSPLPSVEHAGNEYANRVKVKGTGVRAIAEAPQSEIDYYGLCSRTFRYPDITTATAAQNKADELLAQTRDATFINVDNQATLNEKVDIKLENLLPGILVDVDHSVARQSFQRRFMLNTVEVDCMSGDVAIGLQPLKSLEEE